MENNVINIDFKNMTEEQLTIIEEQSKKYKRISLENRVAELEDWKIKHVTNSDLLQNDYDNLSIEHKKLSASTSTLMEVVEDMQVKTAKITDTLLTHGLEKRNLENRIHSLVYKELDKGSIRDQLFHGLLTAKCKYHITKSLGVSSFMWIQVKDLSVAEKLASVFLNKTTMHNEMQNKAQELHNNFQKLTGKKITDRDIKRKGLLDTLVEECEGNIHTI